MKDALPIGIDDFKKLREEQYYYVDKSLLIKELLDLKGEVNSFTRPRRFGKSLNISMVKYFFEDTGNEEQNLKNRDLFEGLRIMKAGESYLCEMGSYPVISLSLKSAKQPDYKMAFGCIKEELAIEFRRHESVLSSLSGADAQKYRKIMNGKGDLQDYITAIKFLSGCLARVYEKKVIILIDEYDVPLENAWLAGFYDEMIDFIRSLFESALKTNVDLKFAVITGCLRITRESIFTGLNNLEVISILNEAYGEYFGFVQEEVDELLQYYGRTSQKEIMKKWYDGYLFGTSEVYNPWSVINYVKNVYLNEQAFPSPYWANTSSNSIVKSLIERADAKVKQEIEELMAGSVIEKPVHEEITYADIYESEDNLWNFLFFTGYLKQVGRRLEGRYQYLTLKIPNEETMYIYENTITGWFRDKIRVRDLSVMYQAMLCDDGKTFQKELSGLLRESISYMDNGENFYHGFLLGILGNLKDYLVKSNREAGNGRYDILIRSLDVEQVPVVLELKLSETFKGMENAADAALAQIEEKDYDGWLVEEGYTEVIRYGIAFYKKQCRVKSARRRLEDGRA